VCFRDESTLSVIQRKAVLVFWYDAEMNNGGFSGYSDVYPDTDLALLRCLYFPYIITAALSVIYAIMLWKTRSPAKEIVLFICDIISMCTWSYFS